VHYFSVQMVPVPEYSAGAVNVTVLKSLRHVVTRQASPSLSKASVALQAGIDTNLHKKAVQGSSKPQHSASEPTKGDPENAVQLVSFPAFEKCRLSITPFGGKIETLLCLADIPYTGLAGDSTNRKHAPKRKVRLTVGCCHHKQATLTAGLTVELAVHAHLVDRTYSRVCCLARTRYLINCS
jgi:hypothetical protein